MNALINIISFSTPLINGMKKFLETYMEINT